MSGVEPRQAAFLVGQDGKEIVRASNAVRELARIGASAHKIAAFQVYVASYVCPECGYPRPDPVFAFGLVGDEPPRWGICCPACVEPALQKLWLAEEPPKEG